jgi:hypothetical protein
VDSRNQLLLRIRDRMSPFGQLYSEILKPQASLLTLERFIEKKGTIEAVLRSVGKTRNIVNRISVVPRLVGPASIVLEVTLTALVIQEASPEDRDRVIARETGGMTGSIGGGIAGAWAGCATAAAFASPRLLVPIVGEISTGTACFIGGIIGGIGVGFLGRGAGEAVGEASYNLYIKMTGFSWSRP